MQKRDTTNFQQLMDEERDLKELPEPGQKWIERDEYSHSIHISENLFLGAFTGKGAELWLQYCREDSQVFTEVTLNGKPAILVWATKSTKRIDKDTETITIKVPKATAEKIKSTAGEDISAKVQQDVIELYAKL